MPYSIVHFLDDDTVETVPGHWVNKKHGTCAWPKKNKTASRLIEKKCMPNEIEFVYLNSRELYKGIDSLVEAKNKAIKAMTMTDLSSADETVRVGRKHRKEIMHSPTSSTNSCPLFSDSDNDDLAYNKSKLSTTAMINSEHLSDRSSSPTVLKVPLAVINDIDSEKKCMYNTDPPVVMCPSDKTIKLMNNRKNQNGWSPLKLDNLAKNSEDPNREPRSMKQCSSKQKSSNETLKPFSERQFSYTEPLSSKRSIECIDSEKKLMFNKNPNCSPPVVMCPSDKTIKLMNNRKNQNGWSPLKLDNLANNYEDTNREPRSMKQWSSKQKSSNETLKPFSEKQLIYAEPLSSKRSIEYNSEPLLKKKPPSNDTPVHMSSFGSKQQCGSSFSKINVKNNKQAVVRELFYSSNKLDELCVSHSNSSDKGKKYDVEHPGSSHSVVAEDTPQHYSNNFQKQVLRMLTYLTSEVRNLVSGQEEILKKIENAADNNYSNSKTLTESLFNDLTDCPLPIDNIIDLNTLEDKISGDKNFRNKLVNELSRTGGKNLKLMVKRIMNKLFADELMSQFSFTGKKGKNKFNNLFVCAVIFDSIKKKQQIMQGSINR
ncbi:uncharacterized protein LOC100573507 isoform X1 [Acyrthosiphon pisum]|uniref:DUF4806 domain-containing protein n=1 Tax=Acyrthosiphon pisum TaxID=7029 RepID=A0A8R2JNT9_ACYPI|nr:uncharacterized protein LOC100573507 isoform X1 [Acyrthosiphon pisum]XP_029342886.1 uncharacterized protein LOC100573507 isoform X1 [Acyrthosiphon pisum]|eukprot:XP_016657803.1 PREDICTED: uncharacterized protein LOC100573507 isoform X2 [Acyrthosiphon pisum]